MKCEVRSAASAAAFCVLLTLLPGCATKSDVTGPRPFDFQRDTFAYTNELDWVYHYDANGKWVHEDRIPEPTYSHHCFVVARSAKQFFQNAIFDPNLPPADEKTCRKLIRRVVDVDPEHVLPDKDKIVIPGYAGLREFSEARGEWLKDECGGAWHSYFQRGNWRMIFPFSRDGQKETAAGLVEAIKRNRPPVVHVVRFPQLTINHAMLLFGASETEKEITFAVYDPNHPERPETMTFDRGSSTFTLPVSDYFAGGRVDVYEVYRSWKY